MTTSRGSAAGGSPPPQLVAELAALPAEPARVCASFRVGRSGT